MSRQNERNAFEYEAALDVAMEPAGRACRSAAGNAKRRFPTKRDAKNFAAKSQTVYGCPDCGGWHLTKKRRHY